MKKITTYIVLAFIMAGTFSSCKKEASLKLEGINEKWIFEKTVGDVYNLDNAIVETYKDENYTMNDYLLLQPDGKLEWVERDEQINGTYKIEKSVFTINYQENASTSTSFSITTKATIVEKTASSFIYYIEETGPNSKYRYTTYLKKE